MDIDKQSLLLSTDTDITISELETSLKKEGYTLNYFPLLGSDILLADAINERAPNLYEDCFGGIEDLCFQVRLAQPDSSIWENRLCPRSATGPSLKKVIIGAQEVFGIPIQCVLKVFQVPQLKELVLIRFENERRQDYFLNSVRKNRVPIPLWAPFPNSDIEPYFEGLKPAHRVLGLSCWGGKQEVGEWWVFLKSLAVAKGGTWYELEENKNKSEWLSDLHHLALQRRIREWKRQKPIHPSHRKLAQRISQMI